MRKINLSMRYVRNSSLLLAAAAGMSYLASCSSEVNYDAPQKVNESTVKVGNDPASQASRVTFFGSSTRADNPLEGVFPFLGKVPTYDENTTPTFTTPNEADQSRDEAKKTAYVLTGGQGQIELYGGDVYITGTVTTHNFNGSGGNVYVMPGGKLILNGANNQNANVYVFGEIETTESGGYTVGANGQYIVKNNFIVNGRLAVEGKVVVNGQLTVDGQLQISNGGVKGKCIEVLQDNFDDAVNITGGGYLAIRSYLDCNGMKIGDNASVYLWPNAMADVTGTTTITSSNAGFFYYTSTLYDEEEGEKTDEELYHALLRTGTFYENGGACSEGFIGNMFAHNLKLKYTDYRCDNKPAHGNTLPASADDYYIPKDLKNGCNPGNGKLDNKPFDPIAVIDGPDHTHHHLSATCVQDVNGKAYVSYHLNEKYADNESWAKNSLHMGCVEVYDVTEEGAQITNWLMNENFDFNHLLVDGNKVYTTGDTEAFGATLGVIELDANGGFGQYEMNTEGRGEVMKEYRLYNDVTGQKGSTGSGNCIIRDGDNFRIASYNGFQSMNASSLEVNNDAFIATAGSAKHIAKGAGYIVTLNLEQKGVYESAATVTVYSSWGTPVAQFATDKLITPINGKNVIACDGSYIYVALGQNGVDKYDMNGTLVGSYSWIAEKLQSNPKYKGHPCANGLCVDDKYVYVANGAAGLIVLDKNDMTRVARYAHATKFEEEEEGAEERFFSANYVQKVGNLLYIAYGRNGLEVLKMLEE